MNIHTDQSFVPAPLCRRIQLILLLVLVVCVGIDLVLFVIVSQSGQRIPVVVLPVALIGPGYLLLLWWGSRIRSYELRGGELVVVRRFLTRRFPLAGLEIAEPVVDPMKGARKELANDGLGAISGTYNNKLWGSFKVYLSDSGRAVLLRWKDGKTVIVSPEHTMPFIDAVKRRSN